MVLTPETIQRRKVPREEVLVEDLGGNVIVRGLLLTERLRHDNLNEQGKVPRDGETEQEARARAGAAVLPRTLHCCVIDAEGNPLLTAIEWDEFGGMNGTEAFRLFNIAMRLSGQRVEDVEKN